MYSRYNIGDSGFGFRKENSNSEHCKYKNIITLFYYDEKGSKNLGKYYYINK